MNLSQAIKILGKKDSVPDSQSLHVAGITCNSREVREGFIFVAVKGAHEDGGRYILEAVEKGAAMVVGSGLPVKPAGVIFVEVEDTRIAAAKLAAEFYGLPAKKLKIAGITGTNGKTTITYLIDAIIREAGKVPAVIGTINYRFKDKVIPAKNTTPGPVELQFLLAQMVESGVNFVAMEVSSHALDQERVAGVDFDCAVFTNLTQDHLDYHHDMERYFLAKAKLFISLGAKSLAVINIDDHFGVRLKEMVSGHTVTYGIDSQADIMAQAIRFYITHTEFILKLGNETINIKSGLIGRHNVYNILAAAGVGLIQGISAQVIKRAIEKFTSVPGRLERVLTGKNFSVFVDYAHTDDALMNVITSIKQVSSGKVIVVFGCGGERDKLKRPKMGKVVTSLADYAVITTDNPRSEDPGQIIKDIESGIDKDNYSVVLDRKEAILKAFSLAGSGDVVVVAGKGHEEYQILKEKTIHFSDREVAQECLKLMN